MNDELTLRIAEAAANVNFGKATAVKRGHNPKFPYVPVIQHGNGAFDPDTRTEQLQGVAFVTRQEALDYAEAWLARAHDSLVIRLGLRANRALREHHGLPREI